MPAAASAAQPGMTVKIPASQDVDNVYVLAAIHQKKCSMQVTGSVLGHRFKAFREVEGHDSPHEPGVPAAFEQRKAVREEGAAEGEDRAGEDHSDCPQRIRRAATG